MFLPTYYEEIEIDEKTFADIEWQIQTSALCFAIAVKSPLSSFI